MGTWANSALANGPLKYYRGYARCNPVESPFAIYIYIKHYQALIINLHYQTDSAKGERQIQRNESKLTEFETTASPNVGGINIQELGLPGATSVNSGAVLRFDHSHAFATLDHLIQND